MLVQCSCQLILSVYLDVLGRRASGQFSLAYDEASSANSYNTKSGQGVATDPTTKEAQQFLGRFIQDFAKKTAYKNQK